MEYVGIYAQIAVTTINFNTTLSQSNPEKKRKCLPKPLDLKGGFVNNVAPNSLFHHH